MANNITPKLRAFVRIDGSGRVVPGSPIFQASKPKVGTWREIPLYYRGDTTNTTTTNGGGGNVTVFVKGGWPSPILACSTTSTDNILFYSSASSITAGIKIYTDAALTNPVAQNVSFSDDMTTYLVTDSLGTIGVLTCISSEHIVSTLSSDACNGSGTNMTLIGNIVYDNLIYGNFNSSGFTTSSTIYVRFTTGGGANSVRPYLVTSAYTAEISGSTDACPIYNYTASVSTVSGAEACANTNPIPVWSNTPYTNVANGTKLYTDSGMTNPAIYSYVAFPGLGKLFNSSYGTLGSETVCS
jgi:hypothetical protein